MQAEVDNVWAKSASKEIAGNHYLESVCGLASLRSRPSFG